MNVRPRMGRRLAAFVPLLAVLALYLASAGHFENPDVGLANLASWNIARTGSPVVDVASYPWLDHSYLRSQYVVPVAGGGETIGRAPGVIAASVPAYWLFGPSSIPRGQDGLDALMFLGGMTSALLTACAVLLLFLLLRRRMPDRWASLAALLFGLSTPVWSVSANGLWPHTLGVLGVIGMAWAADRDRWWLVGLFGGVALWGRLHAAVICAVLGLGVAILRRRPMVAVKAGLSSGGMLGLMCVWTHWMYGSWNPTSGYRVGDYTSNVGADGIGLVNQLGMWVSPSRGLLIWTPLLLVFAGAVARNWRDLPDWARVLPVGGLVYTVLQAALNRFSGGNYFFGYRLTLEVLACLAPAVALSAHRMGPWARRLFVPVAVVQFAVFLTGSFSDLGPTVFNEHQWLHNDLVAMVRDRPAPTLVLLGLGLLIGTLVARIWRDPTLAREA